MGVPTVLEKASAANVLTVLKKSRATSLLTILEKARAMSLLSILKKTRAASLLTVLKKTRPTIFHLYPVVSAVQLAASIVPLPAEPIVSISLATMICVFTAPPLIVMAGRITATATTATTHRKPPLMLPAPNAIGGMSAGKVTASVANMQAPNRFSAWHGAIQRKGGKPK